MNERNGSGAIQGYSPDQRPPQQYQPQQQYPQQYQPQPFQTGQYQQPLQQYQQVQPVQPPQQYQQAANAVVYERYATAEQITEKPPAKKKKGCLVKLLTWVAVLLALVLVIGIVGGSSTEKPASATKNPVPVAQNNAQTAEPVKSSETMSQRNALNSAKSYLRLTAFSRQGLIEQLEYEQYSHEDAVYAVDRCGADWNEQAVKSAKSYINMSAFSYSGLVGQLEYEGFTHEQAVHGADSSGADWNAEAVESAKSYLEFSSFSRQGLIDQLKYEGFTDAQAEHGVTGAGY